MSFTPPTGDLASSNSFEDALSWTYGTGAVRTTTAARSGEYSASITGADDANLVVAGDFETASDWVFANAERSTTKAYRGAYSVSLTGIRTGGAPSVSAATKSITLTIGVVYTVDFFIEGSGASVIDLDVYIDKGSGVFIKIADISAGTYSDWSHVTHATLVFTAEGTNGYIRFKTGTGAPSVYSDIYYIDDVVVQRQTGKVTQSVATVSAGTRIYLGTHVQWVSGAGSLILEAKENGLQRLLAIINPDNTVQVATLDRVTNVVTFIAYSSLDPRLTWPYSYLTFLANGTGALSVEIRGVNADSVWYVDDVIYGPNNLEKSVTLPENGRGEFEFLRSFPDDIDGLIYSEASLTRDLDNKRRRSIDVDEPDRDHHMPATHRLDDV